MTNYFNHNCGFDCNPSNCPCLGLVDDDIFQENEDSNIEEAIIIKEREMNDAYCAFLRREARWGDMEALRELYSRTQVEHLEYTRSLQETDFFITPTECHVQEMWPVDTTKLETL